jgi:hypothetical protein
MMHQAMKTFLSTPLRIQFTWGVSLHIADWWTEPVTSPTPPPLSSPPWHSFVPTKCLLNCHHPRAPWAPTIQVHICSGGARCELGQRVSEWVCVVGGGSIEIKESREESNPWGRRKEGRKSPTIFDEISPLLEDKCI